MKLIISVIAWKLFLKYIHMPSGEQLFNIIKKFRDVNIMQNMAMCIDGCHIPLYEKLNKRKTFAIRDFLN
jgi:hypothetical protein